MEQHEGIPTTSVRTEGGQILSQAVKNKSHQEKNIAPQLEQSITLSDKKKCFACNETSHSLDQCMIKHNLVSITQPFGYATRFPFLRIQPSEEAVEKEKFYHHCLQITSNISNLDLAKVKDELQKSWKLSSGWELRRECRMSFLASFDVENDLISCLGNPTVQIYMDDKEVKFTLTRWTEGDADVESIGLNCQWFLVSGVPRIYRNWMELYQVASAFGVLIGVDEGSLEVRGTQPIRLKIASKNLDDTPLYYHFMFGWSCRMVTFAIEKEGQDIKQGEKELGQWNCTHHLDAISIESEGKGNTSAHMPTKELNETIASENSNSTRTAATTGTLLDGQKCTEESRFEGEIKESKISAPATTTINSKKTEIDHPKTEGVQSLSRSSTNMIGEEHYRGIPKPPVIHVFKRRGKKQKANNEASYKSPPRKQDKEIGPEVSNYATKTTGAHMEERKLEETTLIGESSKSEELAAIRDNKGKNGAPDATELSSGDTKAGNYQQHSSGLQFGSFQFEDIIKGANEMFTAAGLSSKIYFRGAHFVEKIKEKETK